MGCGIYKEKRLHEGGVGPEIRFSGGVSRLYYGWPRIMCQALRRARIYCMSRVMVYVDGFNLYFVDLGRLLARAEKV
jgi:hypothetical protein